MIQTYKASEVRLIDPLPGETSRTVRACDVESLKVHPESRQAFVVTKAGVERTAVYAQATWAAGEFDRAMQRHECEVCGQVFETAQGLGMHRTRHVAKESKPQPVATQSPQAQSMVRQGGKR